MIENIYFMAKINGAFLIMVFAFLDIIKIIAKKDVLRIEVCRIRFVLATIIIGITTVQTIIKIIDKELPQRTVFGDIIMIIILIMFCLKERKTFKQQ